MRESTKVLMDRFNDAKTAINSKYQIISFLNDHGIRIESNHQIRCPFHDDSTPSFSVNGSAEIFGNVLDVLMVVTFLTFGSSIITNLNQLTILCSQL